MNTSWVDWLIDRSIDWYLNVHVDTWSVDSFVLAIKISMSRTPWILTQINCSQEYCLTSSKKFVISQFVATMRVIMRITVVLIDDGGFFVVLLDGLQKIAQPMAPCKSYFLVISEFIPILWFSCRACSRTVRPFLRVTLKAIFYADVLQILLDFFLVLESERHIQRAPRWWEKKQEKYSKFVHINVFQQIVKNEK